MKAIVISAYGPPEVLTHTEVPDPVPADGEVLIRVRAFGLNHAETYMRAGDFGDVAKITGIEAAGTVEADPSGRLAPGTRVIAIMGGLGRVRDGAYAELVTVPAANVVPVGVDLPWTDLAAVPEVYATAWTALHDNLALDPAHTIVIRGATSALGQAAVNLAADHGATVLATTRNKARTDLLKRIGATDVLIDDGHLAAQVSDAHAVLDLVGNTVLRDSLRLVRPRGRVCQIGFLGGLGPVPDFLPLADMPSGVQFSFFASFTFGTPAYPLDRIPFEAFYAGVAAGRYHAHPVRTFGFDDIVTAHHVMEAGTAGGKMVATIP